MIPPIDSPKSATPFMDALKKRGVGGVLEGTQQAAKDEKPRNAESPIITRLRNKHGVAAGTTVTTPEVADATEIRSEIDKFFDNLTNREGRKVSVRELLTQSAKKFQEVLTPSLVAEYRKLEKSNSLDTFEPFVREVFNRIAVDAIQLKEKGNAGVGALPFVDVSSTPNMFINIVKQEVSNKKPA